MKLLSFFGSLLVTLALVAPAQAQERDFKVQTRMEYSEDNGQGIRRQLVHQFKIDALKAMIADSQTPQAKGELLRNYIDELSQFDTIDQYVTKFQFATSCNTKTGKDCGVVRDNSLILQGIASVNISAIDTFLKNKTKAANAGKESVFAMFVTARMVSERTAFKDKVSNVESSESANSVEVTTGGDDTTTVTGGSSKSMSITQSGGSVTQKADDFAYEVDSKQTSDLSKAITQALIDAGFKPKQMRRMLRRASVPSLDDMIANGEFGENGILNEDRQMDIEDAAIDDGRVDYIGFGTVDFRKGEYNTKTRDMRVPAIVSIEVMRIEDGDLFPVASVPPTTVFGNYPVDGDPTVGQTDAQNNAAKMAMDTIVSQLQVAGLY